MITLNRINLDKNVVKEDVTRVNPKVLKALKEELDAAYDLVINDLSAYLQILKKAEDSTDGALQYSISNIITSVKKRLHYTEVKKQRLSERLNDDFEDLYWKIFDKAYEMGLLGEDAFDEDNNEGGTADVPEAEQPVA